MSAQAEPEDTTGVDEADNQFENWAQSLSEFVIRTVVLPVTLLMTKPSAIAQGSVKRRYRPLPSPFLLAVVMGIVISGVVAAVITAATTEGEAAAQPQASPSSAADGRIEEAAGFGQRVFEALAQFYSDADGMRAVLLALPFVAFIWIAAGLISATMFRGVKNVNALFAGFSLTISAIIEVAAIGTLVGLLLPPGFLYGPAAWLGLAFAAFAIVIGLKVLRLIFVLRKEHRSSWIGAIIAVPLALVVMLLAAGVGGGTALALIASHTDEPFERGRREMARHNYGAAVDAYSQGIRYRPDHYNGLNWRAEAYLAVGNYGEALADSNAAIAWWERITDRAPSHFYVTRGAILTASGDHAGAEQEYATALGDDTLQDYERAALLAGRCRARVMWGGEHLSQALEDCTQAIADDEYNWQAHEARGIAYLMQGENERAEQDFDKARPFSPFSQFGVGLLQLIRGEEEAGEENMAAARSVNRRVVLLWEPFLQYFEEPEQESAPAN